MKSKKSKHSEIIKFIRRNWIPILVCTFFLGAYLTLSLIKHYSYLSGYDLSIIDQAIWKYSRFKNPVSTTHVYFDSPIYIDHFELILILLSPIYWLINNVEFLIVLQILSVISSGIAIFLLTRHYGLKRFVSNCILVSYLSFFGLQFAIWSDVHTLVFGVGFMAWFIYFLEKKNIKLTILFLVLSIFCKEDIALLTFLISGSYYIFHKDKLSLVSIIISILYLCFVFFIYFPSVTTGGYHYANPKGLLSDLNPNYFIDSLDKQKTIMFSLGWFGFIPLLVPVYLIPFIGDLGHYFVLGHIAVRTAGIFLHYRSSVGLLLIWPTIIAISKYKRLNNWKVGVYLILSAAFFQYYLHLPLSYLTKKWFWTIPPEVRNINLVIKQIPSDSALVTQNNITPHVAHRDQIYTLFPSVRDFPNNSPCGNLHCRWFRVGGNPSYLLIDIGPEWNILHFLGKRSDFESGISNLERNGNIKLIEQLDTTRLYSIIKKI